MSDDICARRQLKRQRGQWTNDNTNGARGDEYTSEASKGAQERTLIEDWVIKPGWHRIVQEEVTFELDCNRYLS